MALLLFFVSLLGSYWAPILVMQSYPRLVFLPPVAIGLLWFVGWPFVALSELYHGLMAMLMLIGWVTAAQRQFPRYRSELILLLFQWMAFYSIPMLPSRSISPGIVLAILISTFTLSVFEGLLSRQGVKFLYPIAAALMFIPSVFLYYNESALIHALWYLVVSAAGLAAGTALYHSGTKRRD